MRLYRITTSGADPPHILPFRTIPEYFLSWWNYRIKAHQVILVRFYAFYGAVVGVGTTSGGAGAAGAVGRRMDCSVG